jgi:chromosome segregation ATPase
MDMGPSMTDHFLKAAGVVSGVLVLLKAYEYMKGDTKAVVPIKSADDTNKGQSNPEALIAALSQIQAKDSKINAARTLELQARLALTTAENQRNKANTELTQANSELSSAQTELAQATEATKAAAQTKVNNAKTKADAATQAFALAVTSMNDAKQKVENAVNAVKDAEK